MKNYCFLFLALLLSTNWTFSQEEQNQRLNNKGFVFSPGITIQNNIFLEANLLYGTVVNEPGKIPIIYYHGWRAGIESNLSSNNYTVAPKIGYEYVPALLCFRLSAVNYFQNNKSEFRILPELGISLFTFINLNYGYGISFNNQNLRNVGNHRFTITFNLNRKLNSF